ncbi:1-deoxy-D-xylulose-5-phosphate synthase [uncultured virus]|nr:1-deoxy-D-xylulose-5-phosphate synthase [uncultured virus]
MEQLSNIVKVLKHNMFKTIDVAKTGHIGACCSSTELMSVLYFTDILRYDTENPSHPDRDYVLVRGHLGPLRYNIFSLLGWLKPEEMNDYRKYGSRLCGHEDMYVTPGVDLTPSGSLGMLLSYAVGANLGFKQQKQNNRIFCFLGDGEEQEGNVSEAARHASNLGCTNVITIIDANTKQLSTSTIFTDGGANLETIWKGYGWNVLVIHDGHNLQEIYDTLKLAVQKSSYGPVCVIAHTIKGNGMKGAIDHYCGYHVYHNNESNMPTTMSAQILSGLIPESQNDSQDISSFEITIPRHSLDIQNFSPVTVLPPLQPISMDLNLSHDGYDNLNKYLAALSKIPNRVYILTADYPPRMLMNNKGQLNIPNLIYINAGVREQHVFAMAHGLRIIDKSAVIIILCGDAFMYRCADQINVLAQTCIQAQSDLNLDYLEFQNNIIIYSVQGGLSGAQNGATHQSSGQSGTFTTMPGIMIYEPSSGADWLYSMNQSLLNPGVKYIRTHKGYPLKSIQQGPYYAVKELDISLKGNGKSTISDLFPTETLNIFNNFAELLKDTVFEIAGLNNLNYVIVASGMVVANAYKAHKIVQEKGYVGKVINIVSLKEVNGINALIPSHVPIFFLYNGQVQILSSLVCRQMCLERIIPGPIYEKGFDLGITGSVPDVMKHFEFDTESIVSWILNFTSSTYIESN